MRHHISTRRALRGLAAALLLGAGLLAAPAHAQPAAPGEAPASTPSPEQIEARILALESAKDLDKTLQERLLGLYRQAQAALAAAATSSEAAQKFGAAVESAPKATAGARDKLQRLPQPPDGIEALALPPDATLTDLEQRLLKAQAELASLEERRTALEQRLQELQARPARIRERLGAVKQEVATAEAALAASPPPEEGTRTTEARQVQLRTQLAALRAESRMLDQELLSHAVRLELRTAERDLVSREAANLAVTVRLLEEQLNRRRQAEAAQAQVQAAQAQIEARGKHPVVQRLAEENAALSQELTAAAADLQRTTQRREAMEARAKQLEQEFQSTRQKIEIAGLSEALGRLLIEQRRQLPALRGYKAATQEREREIARIGLAQFRADEQRRALSQPQETLDRLLAGQLDEALPAPERESVRAQASALLTDQQALLEKLSAAYATYLCALGDLDFAQRRLVDGAQAYAAFLDERLLWMPTTSHFDLSTLANVPAATAWILDPAHWLDAGRGAAAEASRRPLSAALLVLAVGALVLTRGRLRNALRASADNVGKVSLDHFGLTLKALLLTLLLALPWPLLITAVGQALLAAPSAPDFAKALGRALSRVGPILFYILAFLNFCRSRGVAAGHFRWREATLKLLIRHFRLLMVTLVPAAFVASLFAEQAADADRDSLGRLAFMVALLAFALFFQRLLRPEGGVAQSYLNDYPDGLLSRLRYLWYPLVVGTPVALAGLVAAGYTYAAAQLGVRVANTMWLVVGAVILYGLALRWLVITKRRATLRLLREKRDAARAAAREGGTSSESGISVELPEMNLNAIDAQTRRLLRIVIGLSGAVGLWLIWAQVLPALGFLDRVTLWHHSAIVDGAETIKPVTLASLALAVAFLVVTAGTARSLPGLLEISLFQRIGMDYGSRYAAATVTRYAVVTIGTVLVLGTLGIDWSKLQWLVAALGVGLGFGLQEIFGNFVSGLIILFERPVRVGDTVTVGDLTGTVSRIRIRATTITDWDRKEIVVPNKAFITDRVINWSLTDPITRIVIRVGIAYGSDTTRAHRLILDTVKALPLVLEKPEPTVYFVGFGDSSLDFDVRVFVSDLDSRMPLTHELHMSIERALREAGIEIPFPQRDVHIRSRPPRRRDEGGGTEPAP